MLPELTTPLQSLLFVAVASYCIGSVSFGIVSSRLFGLGELRKQGSGNIGATNVLRTGSKAAAATTLVLDMGKGLLAVAATSTFIGNPDAVGVAALAAFCGHLFPVWHRFRGGKGVATFFGVMAALSMVATLPVAAAWVCVFLLTRTASKSSLAAGAAAPASFWILNVQDLVLVVAILGTAVWIVHHQNIARIIRSEEPTISLTKPKDPNITS